jgi:hypothetical protein
MTWFMRRSSYAVCGLRQRVHHVGKAVDQPPAFSLELPVGKSAKKMDLCRSEYEQVTFILRTVELECLTSNEERFD